MPAGSAPGERRGGRQKGTPNKATVGLKTAIDEVLKVACLALGPEEIDKLSPAQFNRWLAREAAKAGFALTAAALNEKILPYFDARMDREDDKDVKIIVEHIKKNPQDNV